MPSARGASICRCLTDETRNRRPAGSFFPWGETTSVSEYHAGIRWQRGSARFTDSRYSRGHRWMFDGGIEVPASASPTIVALPYSVTAAVDPEEAFVASLASCHMLFFLSIAAARGFVVDTYRDDAVGALTKDASGKQAMSRVTLRPEVQYAGDARPTDAESMEMHHAAHEECFIARSVTTAVLCEPIGIAHSS